MAQATSAQLQAAATKLAATGSFKGMSASQILQAANSNLSISNALAGYLPAGTTVSAPAKATTPQSTFTLPTPFAASNAGTTSVKGPDGTVYYLVPQGVTTSAQWVAQRPGQSNYLPVTQDGTGKPSIASGVAYSNKSQFDMAVSVAQKSVADAKAKEAAAKAAVAESTTKMNNLVKDFTNIVNSGKVTQSDIDSYQSQIKALGGTLPTSIVTQANSQIANATKNAAAASAANAKTQKLADIASTLQSQLDSGKINKAALDKYTADIKAAGGTVDSKLVSTAQNQISANTAKINTAQNDLTKAINAGKVTQAQLDAYSKAVTDAGGTPQSTLVNRGNQIIASNRTAAVNTAQNDFVKAINTGKVTQEQVDAYTKAVKDAGGSVNNSLLGQAQKQLDAQAQAELVKKQQAEQAAALAAAQKQTALNAEYEKQLAGAKTSADIDRILNAAKSAGAVINQGAIDRANTIAQQTAAQQQAAQSLQFQTQLAGARTQADIDRILSDAKAAGVTINQGLIDRAQTIAQQTAAQAAAKQTSDFQSRLLNSGTQQQLDKVIADAKAAGIALDPGYIDRAQQTVNYISARASTDPAYAAAIKQLEDSGKPFSASDVTALVNKTYNEQTAAVNAATQAGLEAPRTELTTDTAARDQQAIQSLIAKSPLFKATYDQLMAEGKTFSSADLISITQKNNQDKIEEINAATQAALNAPRTELTTDLAGRDQLAVQQLVARGPEYKQAYDQLVAAGKPFTAADLSSLVNQTYDQQRAAENAATMSALTGPRTQLSLPEGYLDRISQANISKLLATGNPVYKQAYDQLVATGKPFTSNDLINLTNNINTANLKADMASTQAGLQAKGSGLSFGDIFGVAALLYIAPSIIGGFGSSSAATAAGVNAGELSSMATQLAAAGSTPAEIAGALEAAGVPASAATTAANAATAMISGAIEPAAVLASSSITPEMLALANATADPIAALNAAAGWTAVDTAYLASMGAAPQLISAAESTNIAAGYDPTGLRILTPEETAQIMQGVDPNMISSFAPTEPIAGATGGTAAATTTPIAPSTLDAVTQGALYGAGTSAVVNTITGQPITPESLLMGALGGGVAGGVGTLLPNPAGSVLGAAGNAALTNLAGTTAVNLVTGQPITFQNLATTALIGGTVGGAIQAYTNANGTTTYRYDDGSTLTVDSTGRAVAVTDNTGASVPVAVQKAPVEDRSTAAQPMETTPVSTEGAGGPVAPTAPVDVKSTGISDSPPGTIYQGLNGPEIVLDSGKTVLVSDYETALASGQSISVDGQVQTRLPAAYDTIRKALADAEAGRISWDEAEKLANGAIEKEIAAGNLKPIGDGVYQDPDGVLWKFNEATGMWDTPNIGETATTTAGGAETTPVEPTPTPTVIAPTETTGTATAQPVAPETSATTTTQPVEPAPTTTTTVEPAPTETTVAPVIPTGTTTAATTPTETTVAPTPVAPTETTTTGGVTGGTTATTTPTGTTTTGTGTTTENTVVPIIPTGTTGGTTTAPVAPTGTTTTPTTVSVVGNADGSTTTTYSDGSTTTTAPGSGATGPVVDSTPGTGGTTGGTTGTTTGGTETDTGTYTGGIGTGTTGTGTGATGTGTGTGTGGTSTGGTTGTGTTTTPVEPAPTPTPVEPTPTPTPTEPTPTPTPTEPPSTDTTGGGTTTPTEPPYVAPPIYVPPIVPPTPEIPGYGPLPPLNWGTVGQVNLPGLNPGWITNVPEQYAATSPVQARYSWSPKPYQPGPTFNRALYQQNQPAQPWGLQQLYTPLNIQEYIRQQALANQRAIAPAPAPGPVKPA